MKLKCIGTGYISSKITKGEYKKSNGEVLETCCFQFANLKYIDKYGKRKYSKFLCIGMGKIAKLINENFIENQKVFIVGEIEQKAVIRKGYIYDKNLTEEQNRKRQFAYINTITVSHIEFMANLNDEKYDKDNTVNDNIDEIIKNVDVNEMDKDLSEETFA